METNRHGFDMCFVEMLQVKCQVVTDTLKAITGGTVDFDRGYTVNARAMTVGRENLKADFIAEAVLLNVQDSQDMQGKVHIEVEAVGQVGELLDQRMLQYAVGAAYSAEGFRDKIVPKQYVVMLKQDTVGSAKFSRYSRNYRLCKWDGSGFAVDLDYVMVYLSDALRGTLFSPLLVLESEITDVNVSLAVRIARDVALELPEECKAFYLQNFANGALYRYGRKLPEQSKDLLRMVNEKPEEVVRMGSLTGYADRLLEEMREEMKEEMKEEIREEMKEEMKEEIREEMKEEMKEEIKEEVKKEAADKAAEETLRGVLLTMIDNGLTAAVIKQGTNIDIKQYPELWSHYQKKHAGGVTTLNLDDTSV